MIFRRSLLGSAIFFSAIICGACHKHDLIADAPKKSMDMKEFEEDKPVPTTLWKVIESNYKPLALDPAGQAVKESTKDEKSEEKTKKGKSEGKKTGQEEEDMELMKKRPPLDPMSFHVFLVEKTSGVLGGENWDLKFPPGGGYLDYRYFLPESKTGTFYLKIKYDQDMDPKDTRIYYLSNGRVRQIDNRPVGNGCSRYFDISDFWKKAMNGDGLELNTSGSRHISVTAGTFYFVAPYRGKLRISHLTIKDTRHHDLACDDEVSE